MALKKAPYTLEELSFLTGSPKDSIRGRLSELRKMGFNTIYTDNGYEYVETDERRDKFEEIMDKEYLWNKPISIGLIAMKLRIPKSEVEDFLAKYFSSYNIIQRNKGMVTIYRK